MSSGSTSATSASTGPIGQNPSWPFTRSIEPRSAWRKSWTPKSFAGAKPSTYEIASSTDTCFIRLPTITAISPS